MKIMPFKLISLLLLIQNCFAEEIICKGTNWSYKFDINGSSCKQEHKVIKNIPGAYKKGHISNFDKMSDAECWKSIATIQMDSALCCTTETNANYTIQCINKNIKY